MPRVQAVNADPGDRIRLMTLTALDVGHYRPCMWQHPWLRIERLIRALLADRLTRGPSASLDEALMTRIKEREEIQRAGWMN